MNRFRKREPASGGVTEPRFFHARRRSVWAAAAAHGALGVTPVIGTIILFRLYLTTSGLALDFEGGPWTAAHQILHGASPYIDASSPLVADGVPFVYPAAAAVLAVPFALLPQATAGFIFAVLCIGCVLLTLAVLGVRDWRVYGAVLLWPSVVTGYEWANISVPIVLGIALCWRYRDKALVAGALLALLISVKIYAWPLGLWLLATRRFMALGYAVTCGVGINVVAWAIIGFDQLPRYADLMHALTRSQQGSGFSLVALLLNNDAAVWVAYALAAAVAVIVAAACLAYGRRGRDLSAFALGLGASLLFTPIVWLHYYVLLIVPLAIIRPRFGPLWLLPLAMWVTVRQPHRWPGSLPLVVSFAVGAVIMAFAVRDRHGAAPAAGDRLAAARNQQGNARVAVT